MDKEAWETLLHAFTEDRYRDILLNDALFKLQEEGIVGSMFEKYLEKYRELLRYFGRSTECCDNLLEEPKEFMKIIKTVIRR
ncbi:MAG: hypothetical protein E7190_10995 [Erysipelotrichaceae bacterium]|nr:hypothetical protein [Erysipelotrichaceae bacterium]